MFRPFSMSRPSAHWLVHRIGSSAVAVAAILIMGTGPVRAAVDGGAGNNALKLTPPRLALVDGDVSFWRPGAGDWEAAQVNIPLAAGDALATRDGRFELQIDSGSYVRAGDGAQLRVKSLEPDFLQLEVTQGSVVLDLRKFAAGHLIEVDTPNAHFTSAQDGYYRVDVNADATSLAVRRAGSASLTPNGGHMITVATGEAVQVNGASAAALELATAPAFDDWDRWNYERAEQVLAAPRSYSVASEVYGTDDLERYGSWRTTESYGRVWVPYSVPSGWAPYTTGRWLNDPVYGYSWVDSAPWGWAPYHYGRWVYSGYWGWAPGPVIVAPLYSPALVAFYGPSVSVSISFGVPFFGWTALSWGEPLIPWWGPVGFVGSPCWWGWGGPRVVNNVVINNYGNTVNANQVNFYRNSTAPGGFVGVPKNNFVGGSVQQARLASLTAAEAKPWRGGALPVDNPHALQNMSRSGASVPPAINSKGGAFTNLTAQRSNMAASAAPSAAAFNRNPTASAAPSAAAFNRNPTAMERSRAAGGPPPLANMPKANTATAFQRLSDHGAAPNTTSFNRGAQTAATDFTRSTSRGTFSTLSKSGSAPASAAAPKDSTLPPFDRLRSASSSSATAGPSDASRAGRRYASAEAPSMSRSTTASRVGDMPKSSTMPARPAYTRSAPSAGAGMSNGASPPPMRNYARSYERAPVAEFHGGGSPAMPSRPSGGSAMPSMQRSMGGGGAVHVGGGAVHVGGASGGMHNFSR